MSFKNNNQFKINKYIYNYLKFDLNFILFFVKKIENCVPLNAMKLPNSYEISKYDEDEVLFNAY